MPPEGRVLRLRVRVRPGARRVAIAPRPGGGWSVWLTARAREGKANDQLVGWLARDLLHIPRSRVRIVAGVRARDKVVEIVDPPPDALARLEEAAR